MSWQSIIAIVTMELMLTPSKKQRIAGWPISNEGGVKLNQNLEAEQ